MTAKGTWITGILVVFVVLALAWLAVTPSEKCINVQGQRSCFAVDPEGHPVNP